LNRGTRTKNRLNPGKKHRIASSLVQANKETAAKKTPVENYLILTRKKCGRLDSLGQKKVPNSGFTEKARGQWGRHKRTGWKLSKKTPPNVSKCDKGKTEGRKSKVRGRGPSWEN